MDYEYSGFLKTLLYKPDVDGREELPAIVFGPEDLMRWNTIDLDSAKEWVDIPAFRKRHENAILLEGQFEDVRLLDSLQAERASVWVPLSTLGWDDPRFPVNVLEYPICEITYRCQRAARPAWAWTYPGGIGFEWLPPADDWRTIARSMSHMDFPDHLHALILRLCTASRNTVSMEIESVRFRAMSQAEKDAVENCRTEFSAAHAVSRYDALDEFMPVGVYLSAGAAKRLASMMGISCGAYWQLALEDLVLHHHNCVAVGEMDELDDSERNSVLGLAESFGIKMIPRLKMPTSAWGSNPARALADRWAKPLAGCESILAWALESEPAEPAVQTLLQTKAKMESVDAAHPVSLILRRPNAYPLVAPFFAASGLSHAGSHDPWRVGGLVRRHKPLCKGQQFWVAAPAFVSGTKSPEWSTCPEMRLMLNLAFANGAKGWFAVSYENEPIWVRGGDQRSLTGPFLTFSDLWAELGQRAVLYSVIAPLILKTESDEPLDKSFITQCVAHAHSKLPQGVSPGSSHCLRGPDYQLYVIVSNDVREMTTVMLGVPPKIVKGAEIYDVSDFVQTGCWTPMEPRRHLEMFPGQAHVLLIGKQDVCTRWRRIITERLVAEERRVLDFDLHLVRQYGLDIKAIEAKLKAVEKEEPSQALADVRTAQDAMVNLIDESRAISFARSKITEACAAICGCDGNLCRLAAQGKLEQAMDLGLKVIPLAREATTLRLELRNGQGDGIGAQAEQLADRALVLLSEIRELFHKTA